MADRKRRSSKGFTQRLAAVAGKPVSVLEASIAAPRAFRPPATQENRAGRKGTKIVDGIKEAVAVAKTGKGAKMTRKMWLLVRADTGAFVAGFGDKKIASFEIGYEQAKHDTKLRIVPATLTWEV